MRRMAVIDLFFIAISHNVSFIGKTWWVLMLVSRSFVLLLAGFTLFSDEQERFVCNTIQPGCSNVCFDVFAPVSVLRLWLFHLVLLCIPHLMFATYVLHKVLTHPSFEGFYWSRGGSPFTLENSSSSRELSLHKVPLQDLPRDWEAPRFYCAYFLVVILRILLEAIFSAGQFFLMGLTVPKSFFCYEAPCTSGVECYISRPTEKTLMLNSMLGVAALSILLSLVDLVSCLKAMMRGRRKKEMLMEDMGRGEQCSMFTTTTVTEDADVPSTKRVSPSGSSKINGLKDEKPPAALDHAKVNGGTALNEWNWESKDGKVEVLPSPSSTPLPTHYVSHSHLRAPLSTRSDRGTLPNTRAGTPVGVKKPGQHTPAGTNSGQPSDSSDSQDKRAWV